MWSSLVSLRTAVRLVLLTGLVVVGWFTFQALQREGVQDERIDAAYRFATENPGVLEYIPCFCDCGYRLLHTSVESCFIRSRSATNGLDVVHDDHGASCSQCVDIVHEVRMLQEEGHSLSEIRHMIELTFGPTDRRRWTRTPEVPFTR